MDHEKCYLFTHERPAKRRRVDEKVGLDSSLLLREHLYHELWREQKQYIDEIVKTANETTIDEISSFVTNCRHDGDSFGTLPAGFILAGPSLAAHTSIFDQVNEKVLDQRDSIFIPITSSDSPNLKTLLKTIIKIGTAQKEREEDELDLATARRSARKLLDYDLQLLHDRVRENNVKQVVIALRDCEAFDSSVLSETVELLGIWSNRIPLVILFGIATSVGNLQERLSQGAANSLVGQQFDVVRSEDVLEDVFSTATITTPTKLWLGSQLSNMLLQRHHENLLSTQDFVDSLQYAYMSHFYANPLSVFLSRDLNLDDISKEHVEALRNTPSFRKFAEDSLADVETAQNLKLLLESDEAMFQQVKRAVGELRNELVHLARAIQVVCAINSELTKVKMTTSNLYTKAMAGKLNDSPAMRELLLAVKKAPSDVLMKILHSSQKFMATTYVSEVNDLTNRLEKLINEDESGQPMRSEHDVRNDTIRTTVVAQKVQLSRHKAKLSEKDEEYSKIVSHFHDLLAHMLDDIKNPHDMLGHEIIVYDLRMPHRAALTPKPRSALERALFSPHDYLNCQCCGSITNSGVRDEEASLSGALPPTALLYRLYLESGALVNASDLWSAFAAIMEEESEGDSSKAMPLFQRALAELKYLGLVKSTRKRTDHIAKVAWRGL